MAQGIRHLIWFEDLRREDVEPCVELGLRRVVPGKGKRTLHLLEPIQCPGDPALLATSLSEHQSTAFRACFRARYVAKWASASESRPWDWE